MKAANKNKVKRKPTWLRLHNMAYCSRPEEIQHVVQRYLWHIQDRCLHLRNPKVHDDTPPEQAGAADSVPDGEIRIYSQSCYCLLRCPALCSWPWMCDHSHHKVPRRELLQARRSLHPPKIFLIVPQPGRFQEEVEYPQQHLPHSHCHQHCLRHCWGRVLQVP